MGYFQKNFFDLSEDEMLTLYTDSMDVQIGRDNYDLDKIVELHRLGYLPLEIRALPEGTLVPMGVPCIEITNTVICIVKLQIIGITRQQTDCLEIWLVRILA